MGGELGSERMRPVIGSAVVIGSVVEIGPRPGLPGRRAEAGESVAASANNLARPQFSEVKVNELPCDRRSRLMLSARPASLGLTA